MNPTTFALEYAKKGLSVFPCNQDKTPRTKNGCLDATTNAAQVANWFTETSSSLIGVATGKISRIFVVDCDVKNGLDGIMEFETLCAQNGGIPDCPTASTQSGGRHYYFAMPATGDIRNSAGKLGEGIDIRGSGGYVIAPPMGGYEWMEFEDEEFPQAPEWLIGLISDITKSKNEHGVSELPPVIPKGMINDTLARVGGAFRKMGLTEKEIAHSLLVFYKSRVPHGDRPEQCLEVAAQMAKYPPEDYAGIDEAVNPIEYDFSLLIEEKKQFSAEHPGSFPQKLFSVPGIIMDMLDLYYEHSRKPQPILALMSAVATLGTIVSRYTCTEFGLRSNLYVLGICDSGGGKDAVIKTMQEILRECGLFGHVGPDDFSADAAILRYLEVNPACLSFIDEGHLFLKGMNDESAQSHQYKMNGTLLKLFTSANSVMKGKGYADVKMNVELICPCFSCFLTTTPNGFKESITHRSLTDGLMARTLTVFTENNDPKPKDVNKIPVPDSLKAKIIAMNDAFVDLNVMTMDNPIVKTITKNPDASALFKEFDERMYEIRNTPQMKNSPYRTLYTRCTENADKLALIYAISKCPQNPIVCANGMQWAIDLVEYITKKSIWEMRKSVSRNSSERESLEIENTIRASGDDGMSKKELQEAFRNIKRRSMDDYMKTLIESNIIIVIEKKMGGKGRPSKRFVHREMVSEETLQDLQNEE